jgi:DNA-binding NtrC family response regulator
MKLFLIDDDEQILHSLIETLKPAGYECLSCTDPFEAIKILNKEKFDVLLTDFRMPGMNGIDVLRHVRNNNLVQHSMIMSGFIDQEQINEYLKDIKFTFFKKPIDIVKLLDILENISNKMKIDK